MRQSFSWVRSSLVSVAALLVTTIPEPATLFLLGSGLIVLSAWGYRRSRGARGIQARQLIATAAQCACAVMFALILLSASAANATLILPPAQFQADARSGASIKVVCGAPGPNCGGSLGTNSTTAPQVAELADGPVNLLASTNPGPQIESLTTVANGTFGDAVLTGGVAQALTTFYVAVEQTNPSVPAMAVPVTIQVGMSAGAEISGGGPNATNSGSAALLYFEGSLIPGPHILTGAQTYTASQTCSGAGCDSFVCELGNCTSGVSSTTVTLHRGFIAGDTLVWLNMIAQGDAGAAGDFTSLVDPHIFIDPDFQFANDFAIVLSPGIVTAGATVPEAASALLLGPAALGLGLLAVRRRDKLARAD